MWASGSCLSGPSQSLQVSSLCPQPVPLLAESHFCHLQNETGQRALTPAPSATATSLTDLLGELVWKQQSQRRLRTSPSQLGQGQWDPPVGIWPNWQQTPGNWASFAMNSSRPMKHPPGAPQSWSQDPDPVARGGWSFHRCRNLIPRASGEVST